MENTPAYTELCKYCKPQTEITSDDLIHLSNLANEIESFRILSNVLNLCVVKSEYTLSNTKFYLVRKIENNMIIICNLTTEQAKVLEFTLNKKEI